MSDKSCEPQGGKSRFLSGAEPKAHIFLCNCDVKKQTNKKNTSLEEKENTMVIPAAAKDPCKSYILGPYNTISSGKASL